VKPMRLPNLRVAVCLISGFACQVAAQTVEAPACLVRGVVLDPIPCNVDPTQSYALYLPSIYPPLKRWPIIYAFDPGWASSPAQHRLRPRITGAMPLQHEVGGR